MDTAFKASYGSSTGVHVGVLCEYDALPDIGHACGHNLIAMCGAATGLAMKAALEIPENEHIGKVNSSILSVSLFHHFSPFSIHSASILYVAGTSGLWYYFGTPLLWYPFGIHLAIPV